MSLEKFITNVNTYDLVQKGTVFFVILVNIICLHATNEHFNFETIGQLHASNPLIWFFYLAIVFLWVVTYYYEKTR